jgi:hypothetical protein
MISVKLNKQYWDKSYICNGPTCCSRNACQELQKPNGKEIAGSGEEKFHRKDTVDVIYKYIHIKKEVTLPHLHGN